MKRTRNNFYTKVTVFITLLFATLFPGYLFYSGAEEISTSQKTFSNFVNKKGEITLPADFRSNWSHLGSWAVPDKLAPGYGFHDVYTQKSTIDRYNENGTFPEGTILIKEIRDVIKKPMTTGKDVLWGGKPTMWFVMVKGSADKFPGNPNWGDGWGWTLYKVDNPGKNISTDYKRDCLGCHIPARNTDYVFVEGYPGLREK